MIFYITLHYRCESDEQCREQEAVHGVLGTDQC